MIIAKGRKQASVRGQIGIHPNDLHLARAFQLGYMIDDFSWGTAMDFPQKYMRRERVLADVEDLVECDDSTRVTALNLRFEPATEVNAKYYILGDRFEPNSPILPVVLGSGITYVKSSLIRVERRQVLTQKVAGR